VFTAALALAAHCAPTIAPETLLYVVQVESRFEHLAIGVNTSRLAAGERAERHHQV